jgi:hypothetical protein
LRHNFFKLSAVPAICRRERNILIKDHAIFCRLIGLHPTSSVIMSMIHRKKKDSEGGNDGGHLDNEGEKGEELRKLTTTTAKNVLICIFPLSGRINYLGCSTLFRTGSKHPHP